ncbi:MAG: aminotransferase class III-fold pyridoxal phosphate-dependent enzyme [Caldilineaceae bacterium]
MSLVQSAPRLSLEEAATLTRDLYGIHASASPLPSERDQNFKLSADDGKYYVLKIANPNESLAFLEAQNEAMQAVKYEIRNTDYEISQSPISNLDKQLISTTDINGQPHFVRLLTWLEGVPLGTVKVQSEALLFDLGRVMGELDKALTGFTHPAVQRDFHWDVANAPREIRMYKDEIKDETHRALVERFLSRFERQWTQMTIRLRRGVIQGDANDYNVLVDPGDPKNPKCRYTKISGVLDWGDMIESFVVCEPAIAAAYALLDKEDPLAAITQVVRGFHSVYPLSEAEINTLFDLVCARLCMSVCHSAHQAAARPEDEYLSISERPAWEALEKLDKTHPTLASCMLRVACGLDTHPNTQKITNYLRSQSPHFPISSPPQAGFHIDLSVSSSFLPDPMDLVSESTACCVFEQIAAAGAEFGFGGYGEARMIYNGEAFRNDGSPTAERRTIHLGVDLFIPAGEPIFAPLPGTVHSFHNNAADYDYGPVIMLEHHTDDGTPFYTLYGHLALESLDGLKAGQTVAAGQRIGWIGAQPINGNWTPHLHFQIIVDHLGLGYDFNGVARATQKEIWLGLCPDPNLVLRIPAECFPKPTPSKEATLHARQARIGRNLSISYGQPLKIVRGRGQYLYDDTGRAYLDGVNNVCHVGHCHPHVVRAGQRQMSILNTNTRYLHDSLNQLAERLCATLPEPLSVCFFVCSGSEANELAIRLARTYTGRFGMICVDAGYHGNTQTLIEVSPYKHNGPGGVGAPHWVRMAEMPDPYRGRFKGYGYETGRLYAEDVKRVIGELERQGDKETRRQGDALFSPAGFICESMIGCGGQIVLPDGYMAEAFKHIRAAGGVCIADEVQVGFGRAGSHFWGFQTQGVIPDIVTMGKPFGNGHPLAAVVTTPQIADAFANGMEYFNTFGGNPVSCEIGLAVLDVIEQEELQANALRIGNRIMDNCRQLMDRHPLIGDVRGLGLYIGIELVLDRETVEPAGDHASYVSNRMKEFGILVSTDGPYHNVLKIKPPIIWNEADADHFVGTLDKVLGEDALQL